MKTNLSSLINLISEEENRLNNNIYLIKNYALNTTVEELDGKVNVIEDNMNTFEFTLKEIEEITSNLSKFKSVLYEKNNTFKLTDGRTIQQAIVDNTNLRRLKSCYEQLLSFKNSKKRVTEVNNSYFESKTINYDSVELKEKLEEINKCIQNTDFEISKLNSIEFDI